MNAVQRHLGGGREERGGEKREEEVRGGERREKERRGGERRRERQPRTDRNVCFVLITKQQHKPILQEVRRRGLRLRL